jgi:hypothetical protein
VNRDFCKIPAPLDPLPSHYKLSHFWEAWIVFYLEPVMLETKYVKPWVYENVRYEKEICRVAEKI